MPSDSSICNQPDCSLSSANSGKLSAKDIRLVSCIQPQCNKQFHACCIGWQKKSAQEFNECSKNFLCNACASYVSAIASHIAVIVKGDIDSKLTNLESKFAILESKINDEFDSLNSKLSSLKQDTEMKISKVSDRLGVIENDHANKLSNLKETLQTSYLHEIEKMGAKFKSMNDFLNKKILDIENSLKEYKESIAKSSENIGNTASSVNFSGPMSKLKTDDHQYKLRISGVNEVSQSMKPLQRFELERIMVNKIFQHIGVETVQIKDLFRAGKYVSGNSRPRPLIVTLNSVWDCRKTLLNSFKLKGFETPIFISKSLSADELSLEKNLLRKRYELIQSGTDRSRIKIANLKLFVDGKEVCFNSA